MWCRHLSDSFLQRSSLQIRCPGYRVRLLATHEAGHAIVATALGEEVHRVSVVTRGNGLGATSLASNRDAALLTADELFGQIVTALSGRCAEELLLTTPSTGSEADLEHATGYARDMVTRYGMGDGIGRIHLARPSTDRFLHGETSLVAMSDELQNRVEAETLRLLERACQHATNILQRHHESLDAIIEELSIEETLEGQALERHLVRVTRPQRLRQGSVRIPG